MRETPIFFKGDMVRAILAGRKTQDRRVITPQPFTANGCWQWNKKCYDHESKHCLIEEEDRFQEFLSSNNPYGQPYDELWVRELRAMTFCLCCDHGYTGASCTCGEPEKYKADNNYTLLNDERWVYTPHWASRIQLEITRAWAEPLQEITEEDAIAEAVDFGFICNAGWPDHEHIDNRGHCTLTQDTARMSFASFWDSRKPKYVWDSNPWVRVIEFERKEQPSEPVKN